MEAKMRTARACSNCKMAHTACDSNRPCARCSALGKEDTCVDVERKKRGRPKNLGEGGSDYTQASQGLEIKAEPSQSSSAALGGGFPYQSMVQEAIKRQRAGAASPKQSRFYFILFLIPSCPQDSFLFNSFVCVHHQTTAPPPCQSFLCWQ
jgi:hypothetical protein